MSFPEIGQAHAPNLNKKIWTVLLINDCGWVKTAQQCSDEINPLSQQFCNIERGQDVEGINWRNRGVGSEEIELIETYRMIYTL